MSGLSPGAMLERYEIVRLVGRGGMGEVYHATDTRLRRPVALKVLRADKDQSLETGTGGVARLLREARAAAAFNHPNSVAIYELGEAEGVAYIAMELVKGQSFRKLTQPDAPPINIETKLSWLIDMARALWAAHKSGIVHRDIKPSNIMVSEEGIVKVLDFGLAKPSAPAALGEQGFQTVMGQVLGTPRYMAPEQLEGKGTDNRTDQYAFGLTAYELLCGEYAGGPLAGTPKPLNEVSPLIPVEVWRIVLRAMQRNPIDRYESMEAIAHELRACIPIVQTHQQRPPKFEDTVQLPTGAAPSGDTASMSKPPVAPPPPPPASHKRSTTDPPATLMASTMRLPPVDIPPSTPRINDVSAVSAASAASAATNDGSGGGGGTNPIARPISPMTLPLARPISMPAPALQSSSSPQRSGSAHAIAVAAPPVSVSSGVFPAGSVPSNPQPSGIVVTSPRSTAADRAAPTRLATPSALAEVGHRPKQMGWVAIAIALSLISLTLGAALAIMLRR